MGTSYNDAWNRGGFLFVSKLATLDDLERPLRILFLCTCIFRSPTGNSELLRHRAVFLQQQAQLILDKHFAI